MLVFLLSVVFMRSNLVCSLCFVCCVVLWGECAVCLVISFRAHSQKEVLWPESGLPEPSGAQPGVFSLTEMGGVKGTGRSELVLVPLRLHSISVGAACRPAGPSWPGCARALARWRSPSPPRFAQHLPAPRTDGDEFQLNRDRKVKREPNF